MWMKIIKHSLQSLQPLEQESGIGRKTEGDQMKSSRMVEAKCRKECRTWGSRRVESAGSSSIWHIQLCVHLTNQLSQSWVSEINMERVTLKESVHRLGHGEEISWQDQACREQRFPVGSAKIRFTVPCIPYLRRIWMCWVSSLTL